MSSGNWLNADGLYLEFGTTKPATDAAGDYKGFGSNRVFEVVLDLTTLTATAGATIISNNLRPMGPSMMIEQVEVYTETAATGTGAALNVGLIKQDRSTEVDFDGLIAALPLTSMDVLGEKTTLNVGSTYAGALIGAKPTSTETGLYLCADYDTAAFTAGKVRIRVLYHGYGTITQ